MQKQETLSYEEQFKNESVNFSPFAIWNTGIAPSQTILTVDTYSLACVPYQFSMQRGVLLGALSQEEIVFFQRFKGALAGLGLSYKRPEEKKGSKVFCRCQIEAIGLMKGRDRVSLIVCSWKPIPPDLAQILGEYHLGIERLKAQYEDYRDKSLPVNPETAKKLGYNNFATMSVDGVQQKLALFTLAVNRLEFLLPLSAPDLGPGKAVVFSLFFQRYRFNVKGLIEGASRLPSGVQKAKATLEFSAELVQLLAEYFFSSRHT
jgi:hypothetical protein